MDLYDFYVTNYNYFRANIFKIWLRAGYETKNDGRLKFSNITKCKRAIYHPKKTDENWEVFFPLKSTDHVLLFRPTCSQCGRYWNTSLKECFYCKTKYFRIKVCDKCNKPYPENVRPQQKCDCGGSIIKNCINCGEREINRKRVFVPITFCWYCGTRQNKFEFKLIPIGIKEY